MKLCYNVRGVARRQMQWQYENDKQVDVKSEENDDETDVTDDKQEKKLIRLYQIDESIVGYIQLICNPRRKRLICRIKEINYSCRLLTLNIDIVVTFVTIVSAW